MCGKPKFCSDSNRQKSEQNQNRPKFDTRADGFSTETACNPQFKLKVTKITLLALNVQIKKRFTTQPKPSLAYGMHSSFNTAQ